MRSIVLTLCLGLAVTTAVSQTTKKAVTTNKKPAATTPKKASAAKSSATKKPVVAQPNAKTGNKTAALPGPRSTDKTVPAAKPRSTPATSAKTKGTPAESTASTVKRKTPAAKTTAAARTKPKPSANPIEAASDDKTEFEKASDLTDANEKINALKKFVAAFPNSTLLSQAAELLSATAYAAGEELIAANDDAKALAFYKLAIDSAPKSVPVKLFNDSLSKIATTLYRRGSRADALDLAKGLEAKVADNADQLAAMAMFHASIEDGDGAVRVAEIATKIGPTSAKAFQTLGLAYRVNFQLDDSATAYAKAVELDPASTANKRSLAEIKRALGKSDEAVAIFRDIVANDPSDAPARSGLVLSLFDAGKKDEAETELAKALEQDPRNVTLMGGAAYWYAANKDADKAVDLSQKAIAVEPRYVWSYIALGRGLMLQNKPLEAEEALLRGKQYGNFPTLEYEIASARCMAGFYREAVEGLQKDFSIADDTVATRIGQRVARKDASFASLLADERRASILEPAAADDSETAARLKALLAFNAAAAGDKPDETSAIKAADTFVSGDDKFKLYRELYAASVLLDKKIALQKAFDLANAAVGGADAAIDVPNAGAAVMAGELYDSRQIAFARNELVQVPVVPRPMLSAILRGRVEELLGSALLLQDKPAAADIHFQRAASIYPETSAWWRSAMWRLGSALQAEGKEPEALDAYIKSYSIDKPSLAHYNTVEALYKKVNGSTEGLKAKVGRSPIADVPIQEVAKNVVPAEQTNPALPAATPSTDAVIGPAPSPTAVATSSSAAEPPPTASPSPSPEQSPVANATPVAVPTASPRPEASPIPSPEAAPTPTPRPAAEAPPLPVATPTPDPTPATVPSETRTTTQPEPTPQATSTPADVKPTPEPAAEAKPEPTPSETPAPSPSPVETPQETATPTPARSDDQPKAEPSPEPTATPASKATPADSSVAKVVISPGPTPTSFRELIGERARIADKPSSSSPADPKVRSLFDPIVITVPKHDASTNPPVGSAGSESRSRVVEGQPVTAVDMPACTIRVSQEKVSLLNGGGIASVLIGVDEVGDLKALRAVSSSPDDIAVELDPDMHAIQGRQLYLIRSLSEKTGMFQVTFQLPCGRKEIAVTVR